MIRCCVTILIKAMPVVEERCTSLLRKKAS